MLRLRMEQHRVGWPVPEHHPPPAHQLADRAGRQAAPARREPLAAQGRGRPRPAKPETHRSHTRRRPARGIRARTASCTRSVMPDAARLPSSSARALASSSPAWSRAARSIAAMWSATASPCTLRGGGEDAVELGLLAQETRMRAQIGRDPLGFAGRIVLRRLGFAHRSRIHRPLLAAKAKLQPRVTPLLMPPSPPAVPERAFRSCCPTRSPGPFDYAPSPGQPLVPGDIVLVPLNPAPGGGRGVGCACRPFDSVGPG